MNPVQKLQAAKALIDTPAKWCQEVYTKEGPEGTQYCALGAMDTVGEKEMRPNSAREFLYRAEGKLKGAWSYGIVSYNDGGSHEDVMLLFDTAIELAKEATSA